MGERNFGPSMAELISLLEQEQSKKHANSSHRGCLDIIADILEASNSGTRKTYLMFRCNLAFRQLKFYLDFLLRKNLLCAVAEDEAIAGDLFKITEKGKEFLRVYKGLKALMN